MLFRFRHSVSGELTMVRVFAGTGVKPLADLGELRFNHAEWASFMQVLDAYPARIISNGCVQIDVPEPQPC